MSGGLTPGLGARAAFRERTLRLVREIAETQGFTVPRHGGSSDTGVIVLFRAPRPFRSRSAWPVYAGQFVYHFAAEGAAISFYGSEDGAESAPQRARCAFFHVTESDWLQSVEPMYALLGDLARSQFWGRAER